MHALKTMSAVTLGLSLSWGAYAQPSSQDQEAAMTKAIEALSWSTSGSGNIDNMATVKIPEGYGFLGDKDTNKLLQMYGNLPEEGRYLIAPKSLDWFAVFSYDDSGYVKDDEKIDAKALMKSMLEGDVESNKERKKLGLDAMYTDGWQVEPHYDTATKRLEWGVRLRDESGGKVINYTSRILGRSGVMSATLVADSETLAQDTQAFKQVLNGFAYKNGSSYAEFKSGDKVAAVGLGALVLGGAAAVATKKGFWTAIVGFLAAGWKLIAAFAVAAIAGIGKLFGRKKDA